MEDFGTAWTWLKALAYGLPRFMLVFTILPLFSKEALPILLRMGVVGCLAMFLAPGLLEGAAVERDAVSIAAIIIKEGFIGLLLGFVMAIPLWALETMGDLCDTQRGATIAQTLNPLSGHETSPLGQLFNQAVVTFLFVIGGFLLLLGVVYDSFTVWPVFGALPSITPDATRVALELMDRLMSLTVLLASPVIFCMFLAEAGMALVSRFVPQLQVFFLAMPVKSAIAMLVFAVYAVVLFDYTNDILRSTLADTLRTVARMLVGVRVP
ncbi:MAG: EscT/YscT/HrcT family type III secretion system export apparatus protein [Comamonadaceae bacterium]|nr:MAG: EscT/YscT/HrcT family type III secretion system export apparatus protein [Comamonadaceae bacterium]